MAQPTVPTADVFDKADKVVKKEVLPIPNITADFHINQNTEVALTMLRDMWGVLGLAILSGFVPTYNGIGNQWTVTAGKFRVDGYEHEFLTDFTFTPLAVDQELIIRVIERQLTFETDPGDIGFTPPGFAEVKTGANEYRYDSVNLLVRPVGTADPALTGQQTKLTNYRVLRIAADGQTLTEQRKQLSQSDLIAAVTFLEDTVANALAVRVEVDVRNVKSLDFAAPFLEALPIWQIIEERQVQPEEVGWGSEPFGMQRCGNSRYVDTIPAVEDDAHTGAYGREFNLYDDPDLLDDEASVRTDLESKSTDFVKGFGLEGDFGNVAFGVPGMSPQIDATDQNFFGRKGIGRFPWGFPVMPSHNDAYFGRVKAEDLGIEVSSTSDDSTANDSYKVSAGGAEIPHVRLIGTV